MRFRTTSPSCGCRSVGECTHGSFTEFAALDRLVANFAEEMRRKLRRAAMEKGRHGWDDPKWTPEQIKEALIAHIDKGDPIDIANFAAFWWNRL